MVFSTQEAPRLSLIQTARLQQDGKDSWIHDHQVPEHSSKDSMQRHDEQAEETDK